MVGIHKVHNKNKCSEKETNENEGTWDWVSFQLSALTCLAELLKMSETAVL